MCAVRYLSMFTPSMIVIFGISLVPRSYENVTKDFPFASTLIAPNASFTVDNTKGLSENAVTELMKFNMLQAYPTTVAFVSYLYIILAPAHKNSNSTLSQQFCTSYCCMSAPKAWRWYCQGSTRHTGVCPSKISGILLLVSPVLNSPG